MTTRPFDQGAQAFMNDVPTADCAFEPDSTMQREWLDGWSQRQVREQAHRSRAIAEMTIHDRLGDLSAGAMARLFHPIGDMD